MEVSEEQYNQLFSSDFPISYVQYKETVARLKKQKQQSVSQGSSYQTTNYPSGGGSGMELIKKYFPQSEWQRAYNVMMGESGGNPGAIGDNYPIRGQTIPSVGLFQIRTLPGRPTAQQLSNPEYNVQYAANMWRSQGWSPWTAARKLGYR
jgi:hypothetical protein